MKSELLSQERNIVTIKAEIEADAFEHALRETLRELSEKANIKGFRKGRVPRRVLELYMGKDAIQGETLERVIPAALREIVEEYGLDPIAEPHLKLGAIQEGHPLELTLTVEVRPEVTQADLSSLEVEIPSVAFGESMVDETIMELRRKEVQYNVVDGAVEAHHAVDVSYKTTIVGADGPEESGNEENTLLDLSAPALRPEIREGLLGRAAGDEVEVSIALADDYPDEKVAGRTVRYLFNVKAVKEPFLPEVDSEFIQKVTGSDAITSIEAFREMIALRLQEQMEQERTEMKRSAAVAKFVELSSVDLPDSLVEQEFEAIVKREEDKLKEEKNLSLDAYLAQNNLERSKFDESTRKRAAWIVKQTLVLDSFAEESGLSVETEDLDAEIDAMARSFKVEPKQLKSFLAKDADRLNEIVHRVRVRKTVDHLLSKITFKEVETPASAEGPEA
ncbi:trigger factor [Aminithiophilus ramosus]|uniref:Trigger factor n=1 Tax=Aminithiophilus ramosus TaxID=3029084 RepID=A0A9Q7AAC0_9BACT|nr:trigger factor [Aminithiophilus ramosus]QTX31184.1 trigger factor [Aminithiophilus ramosus]